MATLVEFCNYLIDNRDIFIEAIKSLGMITLSIIGFASILIQAIPVLKNSNKALPLVKFIGKYVALNKSVRRKADAKKNKKECF